MVVPFPRRAIVRRRRAFALLGTVQATLIFTITVVSVPLPAIGTLWGLTRSELILVSAAYALSFSGLLLFGGRLTDRYGGRRLLLTGLAFFAVASTAAAFSNGFEMLVAARFGQGVGAALAAPAAVAVLHRLYADPASHRRAMARWGGLSVLGATAGILTAGVCTWVSWRYMFAPGIAVATLGLLLAPRLVPRSAPVERPRLDLFAAVLATAGVTLVSYGLVVTDQYAWTDPMVAGPLGGGVLLLLLFIAVEARGRSPLLPLSFLDDTSRIVGLLTIALAAAGASLITLLLGLYLQQIRDWTPLRTSAAFLPYGVALLLAGRLCRRRLERRGPHGVIAFGLTCAAAGLLLLAALDPSTPYTTGILPSLLLVATGLALAFAGATVLSLAGVQARQAGLAGGVMNTAMEVGPTVGLTMLMAVAAARSAHLSDAGAVVATTGGYAWAFGAAGAAFALLAMLVTITDRPRRRPDPVPVAALPASNRLALPAAPRRFTPALDTKPSTKRPIPAATGRSPWF
ncbi:MFS transporter [Micromonospora sp. CPCC 205371]|nr:MFS transporter [Micromonospora sp. CPCC 205371]